MHCCCTEVLDFPSKQIQFWNLSFYLMSLCLFCFRVVVVVTITALLSEKVVLVTGKHPHTLPSWQSNESLTNMILTHERTTFGFPTFTPLNSSEMDMGFKGSRSFSKTDPRPWINLFEKLDNHEQIKVHVFGGSMTEGHGCRGRRHKNYYEPSKTCAWQYR